MSAHLLPRAGQNLGRDSAAILLVLLLGAFWLPALAPPAHADVVSSTPLTSFRITGAPNFTNPGAESFWKSIPWTSVPLAASVSPGGGHTPSVLVKSANNGFEVFMLFRWNDSQPPAFDASSEAYRAANGSLLPLNPENTSTVTQLFYNSTYYYPDRVAMLWFLGSSSAQQTSPVMQLGSDGAITGGSADIWHWQSNPTDSNKSDAGFPGGYTDPSGKAVFPPHNVSFAEDDFTNMTGFFVSGGSFGAGAPNLDPYATPYDVLAGNQYSSANKTWTIEMARTLTTDAPSYRVQLSTGSSYYVAFAVWQGRLGESSHLKSVSQWYQLTLSSQAPATPPVTTPTQGVGTLLAASVAVGAALVGFVIGSIAMSYRKEPHGVSA